MKILKKAQKFVVIGLLPALLLAAGCVKDKRFDYSELALRLAQIDETYAFSESDLFFADGIYYCYYSLGAADDTLLTMKEDADGKLDRVTLTLSAPPTDARYGAFRDFALTLAEIFIPEADLKALREKTNLDSPEALLKKTVSYYTNGFYSAAVFAARQGTCFVMKYSTEYEKE